MNEKRFLALANFMMPLPTATYHEHFCMQAAKAFATCRSRISWRQDELGNVLLSYVGTRSKNRPQPIIMTAHLDHPGLVYAGRHSGELHLFEVLGGVRANLLPGAAVRVYDLAAAPDQRSIRGRIHQVLPSRGDVRPHVAVDVPKMRGRNPGPGTFAMWDLVPFRRRGRRLHGRACDDLAGASVGLAALDQLQRSGAKVHAGLLLTRAEEIGFDGMIGALSGPLIQRHAIYINIECSSIAAGAVMGAGPIIRVGDKQSVFDPDVVGGLETVAANLVGSEPTFCYQRRLMDAGSCEATALMQAGLMTGAVALPLSNYHNGGRRTLLAEIVDLDDATNLVRLLVAASTLSGGLMGARRCSQRAAGKAMAKRLVRSRGRLRKSLD